MNTLRTKAFLYLLIGALALTALNDRHIGRHISLYIIGSFVLFIYWKIVKPVIDNKIVLDKAFAIIRKHEINLCIQRDKLLTKDIYGNVFKQRWEKEIKHFIRTTIYGSLTEKERDIFEYEYDYERVFKFFGYKDPAQKISEFIEKVAEEKGNALNHSIQYYDNMTGEEYEILCKNILNKAGWHVDTTKKSGDQGVDLIATKNNVRVAIQCKRYSNNIGNSAVQEIVAGKILYKANFGVVVSNISYTKSAQELANAADIKLLHHYHLANESFYEDFK